jgi:hypothetical protein
MPLNHIRRLCRLRDRDENRTAAVEVEAARTAERPLRRSHFLVEERTTVLFAFHAASFDHLGVVNFAQRSQ